MEYAPGATSWRQLVRRAAGGLGRSRSPRPRSAWRAGVPLIALAAGVLFTTSATTADGTALREDRRPQLTQLIQQRRSDVARSEARATDLRQEVEEQTANLAGSNEPIANQRARGDRSREAAGFTALVGPGLTVELNDAPQRGDAPPPDNASNDDLVVHQGDVQAVVNALWAGGAEAMSIMNVRVLSTSAVRCVGNTLLLHGRVYSPPFKITAIGNPAALRQALAASEGVRLFRDAVDHYQLGYLVTDKTNVAVPAYDGSVALRSAEVPG
ncbi:MAG TPA: DUF881 domain-containing protein [Micromonosporaceae bacterium]